jgi:serine/threonine protein kinase/predicted ATPase
MAERDPLHRLAERLARGQSIDWEKEERAAGEQERAAIRKLRIIAAMSIVNRSLLSGARPEKLSASVAHARDVLRPEPSVKPVDGSESGAPLLPPNSRWGSIEIREHIGGGSFGDVYRARDTRLDREVALKLLRIAQPDPRDEVVREARLLARVRHPNVVTVYGADQIDGRIGIWTEFLSGRTLDEILKEHGLLDAREAALIGIDLCRALSAVHAAGIVHQDVKLRNVMRVEGGRVVLMDFGLGREIESRWKRRSTFAITGTPLFMAPEALSGASDARSDLYSLGVVLFGLVTGSAPVEASTLEELRQKHASGARREVRDLRPDLASGFVQVLQRLLAPDPEQRFQTAGEAERALLAVLTTASDTPTSSTPAPAPSLHLPLSSSPPPPEPSIASSPATPFVSPKSLASQSRSYRLPAEVDSFVGREADLAALADAFRDGARLVTLHGPGGIGKTRLAVRYGREHLRDWTGGVWFCDLTEAKSGDDVASATGAGMGLALGSGDPVTQVCRSIASRGACLLILDNFEQVADHAGSTLASWLANAPDARFVVTSGVRLKLPGEVVQSIEPLPIEPGMQLFADRAPRQRPVDLAGAEADSVREVVRLLEGIPLAIELSAARLRVLTPAQIVERISERFRIAATGGHGRHATLRAAIASSWESLAPWEKAAFCQCAMFEGGFNLEAAEGVLDLTAWPQAPWIVDVLQSLVDKSLIRSWVMEATTASAHPAIRFGMFVSLQEYAREMLAEPGAPVSRGPLNRPSR